MKYLLNCSVYSYTKHDGCIVLFSSEVDSDNLNYLEDLLYGISGTEFLDGEFNPKEPCIKFSSIIGYNDEKENLHIIKIDKTINLPIFFIIVPPNYYIS